MQPIAVWQGGYLWQPFTYMWLHGSLGHIALNCLALWMFGSQLAMAWGPQRFLRYYLLCGVGAGFIIATYPYLAVSLGLAPMASLGYYTLGASGAVYGVVNRLGEFAHRTGPRSRRCESIGENAGGEILARVRPRGVDQKVSAVTVGAGGSGPTKVVEAR